MNHEERIEKVEKEFLDKAANFKALFEHQQKNESLHWTVRLSFVAFVGVLLTIVFANRQSFSGLFISALSWIVLFAFALMVIELIRGDWDLKRASHKQERITKLAKVRHIAILEPQFENYGKTAERILIEEDSVRRRMAIGDPLSEIIKPTKNDFFWFSFLFWPLLYLSIPILLLLEVLVRYPPQRLI